jgi:cytochrome b561
MDHHLVYLILLHWAVVVAVYILMLVADLVDLVEVPAAKSLEVD